MRSDLNSSLSRSHINLTELSAFQRVMLTTDGTVTNMLEAYFSEPIKLVKLSEKSVSLRQEIPLMNLNQGDNVIEREILLQGKISYRNYVYAKSILVLDRLHEGFRQQLLDTKMPIGKIWLDQKVETFKEIVDTGKESANGLSEYFNVEVGGRILFRTYCVRSDQKLTMMITEKFPESYFRNELDFLGVEQLVAL